MINVNSTQHIHSGIQVHEQYQNLDAVAQSVSAKPLQLENDNVDLQKDRPSDKNDSHFSHNRHTALKAYMELNKGSDARSEAVDGRSDDSEDISKSTDDVSSEESPGTKESEDKKRPDSKKLSEDELKQVEEMKKRDTEVRIHENAHKAVGGHLASAPAYEYETGPDGKRYITDGHVNIDISEESDPQKTIEKMQKVRAAAFAPAQPSAADRSVAAEASQKENAARQELREQKQEENEKAMQKTVDGNSTDAVKGNDDTDTKDKDMNDISDKGAKNTDPAVSSKKLTD